MRLRRDALVPRYLIIHDRAPKVSPAPCSPVAFYIIARIYNSIKPLRFPDDLLLSPLYLSFSKALDTIPNYSNQLLSYQP